MSCQNVQELISLLLDGKLPERGRENVLAHTRVCRECGTHLESWRTQRAILRKMAQAPVPDALAASLSVMASHERERQLARVSIRARVRRLAANINLVFDNLMRPVALPLTGGLLSALLLFGLMMPSLSFPHQTGGYDFSTVPRAASLPIRGIRARTTMRRTFRLRFAEPAEVRLCQYRELHHRRIRQSGGLVGGSRPDHR